LKNAYDWLSRDYERFGSTNTSPVAGKKLGVIGASYISDIAITDVKKMVEYLKVNVYT
jgi:NAD(P)H-dependent FMN reductase